MRSKEYDAKKLDGIMMAIRDLCAWESADLDKFDKPSAEALRRANAVLSDCSRYAQECMDLFAKIQKTTP